MPANRTLNLIVTAFLTVSTLGSSAGAAKNQCSTLFTVSIKSTTKPVSSKLIPKVLALTRNESIPTSVIKKYPTTQIATSLVRRLDPNNERISAKATGGFNPLSGTDIVMFFRADDFNQIVENGFLNYHQVGRTGGDSTVNFRASKEDHLIQTTIEDEGYDSYMVNRLIEFSSTHSPQESRDQKPKIMKESRLQSPYNRIRPKYAYLFINDKTLDIGNTVFREQYGEFGAVFKNDVKSRATWTPIDSLAARPEDVFTFQDQNVNIKAYGDNQVKYYFEAQIWGDLNINDVAYWILPYRPSKSSEIYKLMKKTGLPIVIYEMEKTVHPESGNVTYSPKTIESI